MLVYCLIIVLIIFYMLILPKKHLEAFSLVPGNFPCSTNTLLLNDWYPSHKPTPEISGIPQWIQYKNYPIFPAHSTHINNIKQWRQPNNGQCTPNGLCGKFYDNRKVTLPNPPKCPGFSKLRVNFYNSN